MRDLFMTTERLGFGRWTAGDLEVAMRLWGDPQVTRLIGGPFSRDWVKARLAREIATQESRGFEYWPIFRLAGTAEACRSAAPPAPSDEAHVGCCGLRPVEGREDLLELGFHLRPEHWGHGYATEAAVAVVGYAFGSLSVGAIVAGHHPRNDASRRVLERIGFRYVGAELYPPTGLEHPSYVLTAAEFLSGRRR